MTPSKPHTRVSSNAAAAVPLALVVLVALMPLALKPSFTYANAAAELEQTELEALLSTESVLVDALRRYTETLANKIALIKSKTLEIKDGHEVALNDTDAYLNNPINALTMLKRFTADWNALRQYAGNVESTAAIVKNLTVTTATLTFPSEQDLDEAVGDLLRIQDIYKLEPQRLAVGEVNGVKLGSSMSWSDCLEIGRKSDKNGDYTLAKFWMETALGKLPAAVANETNGANEAQRSVTAKARFEILQALLNTEFHRMGDTAAALRIVSEMLRLRPAHKGVLKAKATIEAAIKEKSSEQQYNEKLKQRRKQQKAKQKRKTTEELLIEEACRAATTSDGSSSTSSDTLKCSLTHGNLAQLLLQPLRVEHLSADPLVVVYHNVLTLPQVEDLRDLLEEASDNDSHDGDGAGDDDDGEECNLKFGNMAKRKLTRLTRRQLQHVTGHASDLFGAWRVQRSNYHNADEQKAVMHPSTRHKRTVANALFNLQNARLGGAIVFPQLEFSVAVPPTALLYWSNLNEFAEVDYRSLAYVCPVIAGTQISAVAAISRA